MLHTYKAVLRGNSIEWQSDVPPQTTHGQAINVYITVLEEPIITSPVQAQGQRMAAALEGLAQSPHALAELPDPAAWEREMREDRVLPGRSN